jgi:hypothetical protein
MGLNMWQTFQIITHARDGFTEMIRTDAKASMVVMLLIGVTGTAALVFFSDRAYRVS